MVFFNSSLRTRLSTQKAGMNLGMNTMVLDVKSIQVHGVITKLAFTSGNAIDGSLVRIILFIDKQTNSFLPSPNDVMTSGSVGAEN